MSISTDMSVRDIAVEHPASIRVFEKFGIDYCCGGAKPLSAVCSSSNLSVDEVLARIEQAENGSARVGLEWKDATLTEVCDYIVEKHHAFCREEMPRLVTLLTKVISVHGDKYPNIAQIHNIFTDLAKELSLHMMKEEQVLFPYLRRMEQSVRAGSGIPAVFFGTVQNPVTSMMNEHDNAGEQLRQIRQLANDFIPPEDVCTTYRAMLQGLADFERDLHQHVHLENNILFPRAVKLEKMEQAGQQG